MNNSIAEVLDTLLSDSNTTKALTEIIKNVPKSEETETNNEALENVSKIQRKINIITNILPLLGDKNSEHAKFLLKVLSIAKLISELDGK